MPCFWVASDDEASNCKPLLERLPSFFIQLKPRRCAEKLE